MSSYDKSARQVDLPPKFDEWDSIAVNVGDDKYIVSQAVETPVHEFQFTNPMIDQATADALLGVFAGYQYQPFEVVGCVTNPAIEVGDAISLKGETSRAYSMVERFGTLHVCNISADGDTEIDHEFSFEPKANKDMARRIANAKAEFKVGIDSITLMVVDADGVETSVKLSEDKLSLTGLVTFSDLNTPGKTEISGDNIKTGTIDAELVTIRNLSADVIKGGKLDAQDVEIVNLTVDNIKARSITAQCLAYGTITRYEIGTNQIGGGTSRELEMDTVTSGNCASGVRNTLTNVGNIGADVDTMSSYFKSGGSYASCVNSYRINMPSGGVATFNGATYVRNLYFGGSQVKLKTVGGVTVLAL